ncbi:MAG: glycerophosphodiester phosphodiesterase family protein [bacterium]
MNGARAKIHGHRGARGRRPENTLAAIEYALRCGADGIEADLCVTADDRIVLHHDLRLNRDIAREADGRWVGERDDVVGERNDGVNQPPAIRELTLRELRRYDVGRLRPGSDYAARFPKQTPTDGARAPTLRECAELIERRGGDTVFNLELKSDPGNPELTPAPARYLDLVQRELERLAVMPRVLLQSFDWGLMRLAARRRASWRVGFTMHKPCSRADLEAVKAGGGAVFSCEHAALDWSLLRAAHELGLAVCAWTVNDAHDIEAVARLGVDVITTDYPKRCREILSRRG